MREEEKGNIDPEDTTEWSKGRMADYEYPRLVEFVDELPKSGSGKILWRELQERVAGEDGKSEVGRKRHAEWGR